VWNTRAQTAEELAHKIAVLHRHCTTEGRDPAQIRKTAAGLFKDTFDDLDGYLSTAERYAVHVDLAPCRAILTLSALSPRLGDELIPTLAQIG
jgi:hypothetical protein